MRECRLTRGAASGLLWSHRPGFAGHLVWQPV